jgi:predicted protein tyrosine phosphatase
MLMAATWNPGKLETQSHQAMLATMQICLSIVEKTSFFQHYLIEILANMAVL